MTNSNVHDSNKLALEAEKPRKAYEPPKLILLEGFDIAGGEGNVPEGNGGSLES